MKSENKVCEENYSISIKFLKNRDKEKLLKEARGERYRGTKVRMKSDFLSKTMQPETLKQHF